MDLRCASSDYHTRDIGVMRLGMQKKGEPEFETHPPGPGAWAARETGCPAEAGFLGMGTWQFLQDVKCFQNQIAINMDIFPKHIARQTVNLVSAKPRLEWKINAFEM